MNAPHLVALVRAGAVFHKGKLLERPVDITPTEPIETSETGVAKIVDDTDVLLEFYRYPAEHWVHLRTTNPIESTFATVRLRTQSPRGPAPEPQELPWPTSLSMPHKPA